MVLQNATASNGWLSMEWKTAFNMGWANIIKATKMMSQYFKNISVMAGVEGGEGKYVDLDSPEIPQGSILMIRGDSTHFDTAMQIVLRANTDIVQVTTIAKFPTDYKSLSLTFGQFMDSFELVMYASK